MIYSLLFQKSFNQISVPKSLAKNKVSARITASNAYNNLKMMPIGVPKVAYRVPGSPQLIG